MNELVIDLGKGVKLVAPIKLHMTVEEWARMTNYINSLLRNSEISIDENITIIKK
jgi:hypothetical protein